MYENKTKTFLKEHVILVDNTTCHKKLQKLLKL